MKYVPAELIDPTQATDNFVPNAIRVQVCYLKDASVRGYYVDVAPVFWNGEREERLITPKFARYQTLFRAAKRLHTRALTLNNAEVDAQIEQQGGDAWDAVLLVAKRAGMRILAIIPTP